MLVQPLRSPNLRQAPATPVAPEPKVAVLLNANARKVDARVVKSLSHIVPEEDLFLSRSPLDARRITQTVLERVVIELRHGEGPVQRARGVPQDSGDVVLGGREDEVCPLHRARVERRGRVGFQRLQPGGALEPAGEIFDTAPYGWPVAKDSGLAEPLRRALEHLMQTGEYKTIATIWGVEKGMIDKPAINGAIR